MQIFLVLTAYYFDPNKYWPKYIFPVQIGILELTGTFLESPWLKVIILHKVQLFWEGHKSLLNLPHGFDVYK